MGFLAQGPEEKHAFFGRATGFSISITVTLSDIRLSLGRGVPVIEVIYKPVFNNYKNEAIAVVIQNHFV
jgi:hypothetical protein